MSAWKLETDIGAAELPRLLRQVAEALETGAADAAGPLSGFPAAPRELELSACRRGAGFAFALKAKRAEEHAPDHDSAGRKPSVSGAAGGRARETDAAERTREKYRQLKKLMQADYKVLQRAAEAGSMPAPDVLDSFLALCESMAEIAQPLLPAHGAEAGELGRANLAFVEDALALRRAASARDPRALAEILARLERRKSACHAQFR
jgi:XXXCH domain-containing protein